MSKPVKLNLNSTLDLVDEGKYPIIHYSAELSQCDFCCYVDYELLTQCTHYLVVVGYDDSINCIEVVLITHSSKFGNISPEKDQYYTFYNIEIDYYTKNIFVLSYECLEETYLYGYFNYV